MFKKYSGLLLLCLVLWSACRTGELPPDMPDEPVFTAGFSVNGEAHSLAAGVEDVYLFTRFEEDDANVLVLSGTFAQSDCPQGNCAGSLTFEFRNDRTGSEVLIDTLLRAGTLEYYYDQPAVTDEVFRYRFFSPDSADYPLLQWKIDNAPIVIGTSIVREFAQDTVHTVQLFAFRNGALKSKVGYSIDSDTTSNNFPTVGITVLDSMNGGAPYSLIAETHGSPVSSFEWNTGAATQQITAFIPQEIYAVHVESPAGDTAYAGLFGIDPVIRKTADFGYTVQHIVSSPDTLYLNRINIRWVDEDGRTWESRLGVQTPDATFQILSSTPYDLNENGVKTRKMEVSFSCRLYNDLEPLLSRVVEGTAVIAVGYP